MRVSKAIFVILLNLFPLASMAGDGPVQRLSQQNSIQNKPDQNKLEQLPRNLNLYKTEGTEAFPTAVKQSDSYFKKKIDLLKLKNLEFDKSKLSIGTESGSGGDFLEINLYRTFHQLYERLKIDNPDKLDLDDFYNLIENLHLEFSDTQLYLNLERKDAVNYFPQELRLKIYRAKWEEHFDKKRDVLTLVYHELLPYFFGNDPKYIRSRDKDFQDKQIASFDTVENADYAPVLADQDSCLIHLDFNKIRKTITLIPIDNYLNSKACEYKAAVHIFQCFEKTLLDCIAMQRADENLYISLSTPDQIDDWGWRSSKPSPSVARGINTYRRINSEENQQDISLFEDIGYFSAPNSPSYSTVCQSAFFKAERMATKRCEATILDMHKEKCETVDSDPVYSTPRDPRYCMIRVKVRKSFF